MPRVHDSRMGTGWICGVLDLPDVPGDVIDQPGVTVATVDPVGLRHVAGGRYTQVRSDVVAGVHNVGGKRLAFLAW